MKGKFVAAAAVAAIVVMGVSSRSQAADFWDLISGKVSSITIGTGVDQFYVNTLVNSAKVQASWIESFGAQGLSVPGVFDSTDQLSGTLDIYNRYGVLVLQSPPNLTRDQVNAWAAANAAAIFNALFPAGVSELTGAIDDNILASVTVSQNLFKKVTPARKNQNNAAAAKNEVAEANAEYQNLKVNNYTGRSYSVVMGFAKEADSGLSYSLTIPYRAAVVNDDLGSRSRFLGMEMAAKYPVVKWGANEWYLGGCLFGSAYELKTDGVDKSGNLKYGGGVFTSVNRELGFGNLAVGVDYRIAKAHVPSSLKSDSLFFQQAADYINDLSPVKTFSYGFNFGVPLAGDSAAVNLEVIRSNFISDDVPSAQKGKTSVGISGSIYPSDTFELNLGISRDYGIDNVRSFGFLLGVIKRF